NSAEAGVYAAPVDDNMTTLEAEIIGPAETPYSEGRFKLAVTLGVKYPFEPPQVRFITPVYHPNIDSMGRICLDTLKAQPQGSWAPSVNINTLLLSIRLLLAYPNADDCLVPAIAEEYKCNIESFRANARRETVLHAGNVGTGTDSSYSHSSQSVSGVSGFEAVQESGQGSGEQEGKEAGKEGGKARRRSCGVNELEGGGEVEGGEGEGEEVPAQSPPRQLAWQHKRQRITRHPITAVPDQHSDSCGGGCVEAGGAGGARLHIQCDGYSVIGHVSSTVSDVPEGWVPAGEWL
ncbi:ubiquitin-conjugating enzyme/RWD-like protein, partial [Ochromonadaceae sp. CCMP2298]